MFFFFFSSRRRHTRLQGDWSSDVCSSDLPGPIGAVITPQLIGISKSKQLPYASSLCGACREVCPVKIDIPAMLLHLRSEIVGGQGKTNQSDAAVRSKLSERIAFRAFGIAWRSLLLYRVSNKVGRLMQRTLMRPDRSRLLSKLASPIVSWDEA